MLFRQCAFSNIGEISWKLCDDDRVINFAPKFGNEYTLRFDLSKRFCTGWYDMENKCEHACPESAKLTDHDICVICRDRTGFNPAFYNSKTISPAQESRNREPHALYLAYFGGDLVKVGISHVSRKLGRLLEQGARFVIVLETFATANVARKYEAQIAKTDGFVEAMRGSTKLKLLEQTIDPATARDKLSAAKDICESELNVKFNDAEFLELDKYYSVQAIRADLMPFPNAEIISGVYVAQIGDVMIMQQQSQNLFVSAKGLSGYNVKITSEVSEVSLPLQQTTLF